MIKCNLTIEKGEKMGALLVQTGSAAGYNHKMPTSFGSINNQDATSLIQYDGEKIGGVVCDGCGSMEHSEIGSRFGAEQIAAIVEKQLIENNGKFVDWIKIKNMFLEKMDLAVSLYIRPGVSREEILRDYFSFTVIVGLVIQDEYIVAHCGDGMYMIDDEVIIIKNPAIDAVREGKKITLTNAPPYLVHNLVKSDYTMLNPEYLDLTEVARVPIKDIQKTALVASDGFEKLATQALDMIHHPLMMKENALAFWLSREVMEPSHSAIKDDVSVVMIRTQESQAQLVIDRDIIKALNAEIVELKELVESLLTKNESLESQLLMARTHRQARRTYPQYGSRVSSVKVTPRKKVSTLSQVKQVQPSVATRAHKAKKTSLRPLQDIVEEDDGGEYFPETFTFKQNVQGMGMLEVVDAVCSGEIGEIEQINNKDDDWRRSER